MKQLLIILIATVTVIATFVLMLIGRSHGLHPNFGAFFIITPLAYGLALGRAFMADNKPPVVTPVVKEYFDDELQKEYRQYVFACMDVQEIPVRFKDWFETTYWYEITDNTNLDNKEQYPYNLIQN